MSTTPRHRAKKTRATRERERLAKKYPGLERIRSMIAPGRHRK